MTKLFCGHRISTQFYAAMYKAKRVRCPKCGIEWRGSMVMERNKGEPKRELREAQFRGKMTSREFFRGDRRPRK